MQSIDIMNFLAHWVITSVALWVAAKLFSGMKFDSKSALLMSALALGLANAVVKPILFWLTLPLTIVTLGVFYLVLNALMLMLVAKLIHGFKLNGFWTAFFASLLIGFVSWFLELFLPGSRTIVIPQDSTTVMAYLSGMLLI